MNREIKLFLSSTFDEKMLKERDYFRNEINAELNHIVGQIGKNLFIYGYELGISKDELFSNILDIVFRKIDKSDYFVGIVGDNYGTPINYVPERSIDYYTGKFKELVNKGIQEDLSPLELEFIKSLENKNQKKIFFIQDTILSSNIKIQKLIIRIKTSTAANVSIFYYRQYEDILFELKQYFKNEISNELYKLNKEEINRNLIYANKTRYYVPNATTQKILNELDNYVNNDSRKIFVLSGDAGSGKRTTLMQWIRQQEENYILNSETKIISAFAGIEGLAIKDILLKIFSHVPSDDKLYINQKDEKSLLSRFAKFTLEVSQRFSKIIIIIDGINQLKFTSDWESKYWWLNIQLENNVKVIVSTTDNVEDTHFDVHKILFQNLSKLIKIYLYKEGKEQLYNNFREKLDFEAKDELPIFARLICTEICMTAKYDTIDAILDEYNRRFSSFKDSNIFILYKGFLKRLSKRISLKNNVVQEICRYLYYSENGLHIDTLQQLFKDGDEQVNSFYFLFYNELIINYDGKITFSTIYFRQAVEDFYIDEDKETAYRTVLIDILEKNNHAKERDTIAERAFQIFRIRDKQRMYDLLSDIDIAEELYSVNRIRFLEYLDLIEDKDNLYENENNEILSDKNVNFLALYYKEVSNYNKSLLLQQNALAINENTLGKGHPNTATTYNNIGELYMMMGHNNRALEYYSKALSIYESILGNVNPDLAFTYNNIGLVYVNKGDYYMALEYYNKTLAIYENILGKENPNMLSTYNNIAVVYLSMGNYDRALEYSHKALVIVENVLGREHTDTAITYNNIASIFNAQGNYDLALEYYSKTLAIYEIILDKKHPDLASTFNNIGLIYANKGDYDLALEYYSKTLAIHENILGIEHPNMASTYNNIGLIYDMKGEYDWALEYYEKALAINEKALGKGHLSTATTYNNIASVYRVFGNYDIALEYYYKALVIYENNLGIEHPDVASTYNNIGLVYDNKNDYDCALGYYRKALVINEKALGKEHPSTAITYNNIAAVYLAHSNYDIALEYYRKALDIYGNILGKEHPHIATTYNNIGEIYRIQGNYDLALEWYLKGLPILVKVLGIDHPNTIKVFNNIAFSFEKSGKAEPFEVWLKQNYGIKQKFSNKE